MPEVLTIEVLSISDCFAGRIGISGCGIDFPDAVLLINQLPGVSLENIDALADDEQETFAGVWADVVLRTMHKFRLAITSGLAKCYRITDQDVIACLICAKKDLFDVALWYLHGVELMIERTSTDEVNRWTTIDLDKAEKLKAEFYAEFESSLADALKSINPKDSDCIEGCVDCVEPISWKYNLP